MVDLEEIRVYYWGKDSLKGKKLVSMGAHCIYIVKFRQICINLVYMCLNCSNYIVFLINVKFILCVVAYQPYFGL